MSIESDIEAAKKQGDEGLVKILYQCRENLLKSRREKAQTRVSASQLQLDMLNVARQRNEHIAPVD